MTKQVTVVGSGASGVHFALSLLKKGHAVRMFDVGYEGVGSAMPEASLNDLKNDLPDPVDYFLGRNFEALSLPEPEEEYYAFPPSKEFVFREAAAQRADSTGFEPLFSFARGGLAEAWTGGVYPFSDDDLSEFPFGYDELRPYYEEVARRIGVNGVEDDLTRFMPAQECLQPPLRLNRHAAVLLERYAAHRRFLNHRLGCYLGRSRIATLTASTGARSGCEYLGRCLWGCPNGAFYTPSITLEACRRYPQFEYVSGSWVDRFTANGDRRISSLIVRTGAGAPPREFPVEVLALAAGTLSSARIFLESFRQVTGESVSLTGLMDNRQILVPFVSPALAGTAYENRSYQYHQLVIGMKKGDDAHYVHGIVTTLSTALAHPILQSIPLDLRTAIFAFRNLRAALGLLNVNLHDTRRPDCRVELETSADSSRTPGLRIRYVPERGEKKRLRHALRGMKAALRRLGCVLPPGLTHVRPMGASVHYAGTIPMSGTPRPLTASPLCRSHDFENLYLVDGTTYPFLPAKNITFTLMANAARVADRAF